MKGKRAKCFDVTFEVEKICIFGSFSVQWQKTKKDNEVTILNGKIAIKVFFITDQLRIATHPKP